MMEEKLAILKDHMIRDPSNVIAILPSFEHEDEVDEKINNFLGEFKLFPSHKIKLLNPFGEKIYEMSKSEYSKEYIDKAIKTAGPLFIDDPQFYLRWDKKKEEYIEEQPLLIVFDKLVFVLAPRDISQDGEDD